MSKTLKSWTPSPGEPTRSLGMTRTKRCLGLVMLVAAGCGGLTDEPVNGALGKGDGEPEPGLRKWSYAEPYFDDCYQDCTQTVLSVEDVVPANPAGDYAVGLDMPSLHRVADLLPVIAENVQPLSWRDSSVSLAIPLPPTRLTMRIRAEKVVLVTCTPLGPPPTEYVRDPSLNAYSEQRAYDRWIEINSRRCSWPAHLRIVAQLEVQSDDGLLAANQSVDLVSWRAGQTELETRIDRAAMHGTFFDVLYSQPERSKYLPFPQDTEALEIDVSFDSNERQWNGTVRAALQQGFGTSYCGYGDVGRGHRW